MQGGVISHHVTGEGSLESSLKACSRPSTLRRDLHIWKASHSMTFILQTLFRHLHDVFPDPHLTRRCHGRRSCPRLAPHQKRQTHHDQGDEGGNIASNLFLGPEDRPVRVPRSNDNNNSNSAQAHKLCADLTTALHLGSQDWPIRMP